MAAHKAEGWHREDIKAALRKAHGPLRPLSLRWGYSHAGITNAIARADYSAAIERRIAAALELSPHTLWPDRWTPEGESRPRTVIARDGSRVPAPPHRQKRAAA